MRSLLTAGLMAGLALASPAWPRTRPERGHKPPRRQGLRRHTVARHRQRHDHHPRQRHRACATGCPPQYQNLPDDVLLKGLLDQLVDQAAPGRGAVGLARRAIRCRSSSGRERAARGAGRHRRRAPRWPTRSTTPRCKAAYDKQVAAFKPAPEFNAAHILVDSEDKAKALKAEIDGGKDFADGRQGELQRRVGRERRRSRLVRRRPDGAGVRDRGVGDEGRRRSPSRSRPSSAGTSSSSTTSARPRRRRWTRQRPEIENQLRQAALRPSWSSSAPRRRSSGRTPGTPPAAIRESDLLTN